MNHRNWLAIVTVAVCVLVANRGLTADDDELGQRLKSVVEKIQALVKEGKTEEAEALKRDAQKLAEAMRRERLSIVESVKREGEAAAEALKREQSALAEAVKRKAEFAAEALKRKLVENSGVGSEHEAIIKKHEAILDELKSKLERYREVAVSDDATVQALKEKIAVLDRQLDLQRTARMKELAGDKIRTAKERMEHMAIAAEHLVKADMKELAEQVRTRMDQYKLELAEYFKQVKESTAESERQATDAENRELRELVKKLQSEIHELRTKIEKR